MANVIKGKVTLKSCDEEEFVVDEAAAKLSDTINHIITDGCAEGTIPLDNITGPVLAKVIEYCNKHAAAEADADDGTLFCDPDALKAEADLKAWDAEFVKVDQDTLFDLIEAANYLSVKGLLDLTCMAVADIMAGKSINQIRDTFHIANDYTEEEELAVKMETSWAFDDE